MVGDNSKLLETIRVVRGSEIDRKFRFESIPRVFDQSECDPRIDRVLNEKNDWGLNSFKSSE